MSVVRMSIAVRPSAAVLDALRDLPRPVVRGVTWSVPEQWIVKLRPLGHLTVPAAGGGLEAALVDAVADAVEGAGPVECVLGPRTVRLGGQWLAAPARGLDELGAAVFDATSPIVPVTHPQPFRADLVLARGRVPADLAGAEIDLRWTVEQVVLVADRSSPRGARLEDRAEVPLASTPSACRRANA
ncbi:hypothetical protein Psed_4054 [Pseudonocardia dioxanivorans CB1190]|uniref:2'-5' RNA ligase n=1 Tax=Pseudonocardia dioxanivorans (strain ATCC 55486 / DSM 44775 / JCM 13855 / CB1190) TaxID=675635 RepID=F4CRK9_PSEUX|nr:hypothetical protein [Pseudonocardia dioxanivorans]AEA26217.1 hypothetical protein Psed_4054 [Pseudonocardia dioxanivorans CB1190]GJF03308.1 hypothetical protein PSD17_22680 [Pseudonocardia sp. D17]